MAIKKNAIIRDFTRGPVLGNLIGYSIPFMLSSALHLVYSLVDMIVVGHYVGTEGQASVVIASPIFNFMQMAFVGLTTGGQVYISQLIGNKQHNRLNNTLGSLFSLSVVFGVFFGIVTIILANPLLRMLNTPDVAMGNAKLYLIISSIGLPFSCLYSMFGATMRGMGDSRHPLIFIVIGTIVNLFLDILFVAGFNWSVSGAALATVIAQMVKLGVSWRFLYRKRRDFHFNFKRESWNIDTTVLKGLLRLGFPFAIRFGTIHVSMLFVHALINALGHQYSAAFGIGLRLDSVVVSISHGVTSAASGIIGQNYGAHNFERIKKTIRYAWMLGGSMFAAYGLVLVTMPEQLFKCFNTDPEVLKLAPVFAFYIVWQFPALALTRGTAALVTGIGNAWLSFIFAAIDAFLLRIFLSWFLGDVLGMGFSGYILGYGLAAYGIAIPSLLYYLFCPWQKRKLVID